MYYRTREITPPRSDDFRSLFSPRKRVEMPNDVCTKISQASKMFFQSHLRCVCVPLLFWTKIMHSMGCVCVVNGTRPPATWL